MARKIEVEIIGDTSSLERALSRSGKATSKWQAGLTRAAKGATFVLAGLGVAAFKATRDASKLNEMLNATRVVFGKSAKQVENWSKRTDDAFAQVDFLGAAKSFATFARAAGLGDRATAEFSKGLLEAAQDMASFHDADPTQVLDDLRSGLAGETEPLRKYGILVNEAALQQQAMKMGLIESGEAMSEREKVLARQALILGQLGAAEGDWTRTRESAANQERMAIANAKDLSAQLGGALLPLYTKLIEVGLRVVAFTSKHSTTTKVLVGVLASAAAAIIAVKVAWVAYTAATRAATIATVLLSAAQKAMPLIRIATLLIALGTALVIAYKKSKTFRDGVNSIRDSLGPVISLVADLIAGLRELTELMERLPGGSGGGERVAPAPGGGGLTPARALAGTGTSTFARVASSVVPRGNYWIRGDEEFVRWLKGVDRNQRLRTGVGLLA